MRFPVWINRDCKGLGHFILTPNTRLEDRTVIPCLMHSMKFFLLSKCRVGAIDASKLTRGVISEIAGNQMRVAADAHVMEDSVLDHAWDSTAKHQILWLIERAELLKLAGLEETEIIAAKGKSKGKTKKVMVHTSDAVTKEDEIGRAHV